MTEKNEKKDISQKINEYTNKNNVTKYGEQVCSEFAWLPLDKQKENAEKFNRITKKTKNS